MDPHYMVKVSKNRRKINITTATYIHSLKYVCHVVCVGSFLSFADKHFLALSCCSILSPPIQFSLSSPA
ncbi:hypothetical protein GLYMA_16G205800v4 [Glycine max]|uniref:Uncharacterized protein n=1 Tax=Glycine max TaxID=3847 RepID=K7MIR5_SOYBN|nr:hypothetical protein GYH30_045601 [Glycine max]KRH09247.1 hypothetical protein GLYMA_16G205800v4 [Glycine max]